MVLRYYEEVISFNDSGELINKLKDLQKDFDHQFVVIEKEGSGFLEFVLGMKEETLIFYTPESDLDDCKITCNASVDKAKSEDLTIKTLEGSETVFTKSNTVPLEKGYKVIDAYLKGDEFLHVVDWYSY